MQRLAAVESKLCPCLPLLLHRLQAYVARYFRFGPFGSLVLDLPVHFSIQHLAPLLACRHTSVAVVCSGGQYRLYTRKEFLMECKSATFKFLHELIYNKLCYINNNESIECLIKWSFGMWNIMCHIFCLTVRIVCGRCTLACLRGPDGSEKLKPIKN